MIKWLLKKFLLLYMGAEVEMARKKLDDYDRTHLYELEVTEEYLDLVNRYTYLKNRLDYIKRNKIRA